MITKPPIFAARRTFTYGYLYVLTDLMEARMRNQAPSQSLRTGIELATNNTPYFRKLMQFTC